MGLMDRDYFVEESLKRIGIIDRNTQKTTRPTQAVIRPARPSQWRPVIGVAFVMVLLATAVRAWRSGWF